MKMFNAFLNDESGAVTVDWVVLTAALVALALAALSQVESGVTDLSDEIAAVISALSVPTD